jgi:hypothetical protein
MPGDRPDGDTDGRGRGRSSANRTTAALRCRRNDPRSVRPRQRRTCLIEEAEQASGASAGCFNEEMRQDVAIRAASSPVRIRRGTLAAGAYVLLVFVLSLTLIVLPGSALGLAAAYLTMPLYALLAPLVLIVSYDVPEPLGAMIGLTFYPLVAAVQAWIVLSIARAVTQRR